MNAEVKDRPTYEEDFYAWTRNQAKYLRAQARLRKNERIDWMKLAEEVGEGWLLGSGTGTSHTSLGLYRIRVAATAHYDPLTGQTLGVSFEKVASFTPAEIEPGATGFWDPAGGLTWDATDDGVIFQIRISHSGSMRRAWPGRPCRRPCPGQLQALATNLGQALLPGEVGEGPPALGAHGIGRRWMS